MLSMIFWVIAIVIVFNLVLCLIPVGIAIHRQHNATVPIIGICFAGYFLSGLISATAPIFGLVVWGVAWIAGLLWSLSDDVPEMFVPPASPDLEAYKRVPIHTTEPPVQPRTLSYTRRMGTVHWLLNGVQYSILDLYAMNYCLTYDNWKQLSVQIRTKETDVSATMIKNLNMIYHITFK